MSSDKRSGEESIVSKFYANQHVLITGATGFLGKILVEKLLRSCPDISKIYIVVRPKKDAQPTERFKKILSSPIFDKIRRQPDHEVLFNKVQLLSGDIVEKELKLANDDLNVIQNNVTIIFHTAATVRFDEPLKSATALNIGGTKNLLDLACTCQKLKAFVHVSTAYCHSNQHKLEEKLYRAPHSPVDVLNLMSWIGPNLLKIVAPELLKDFPNTYAYTKCLAEQLVSEYSSKLPVVIARPSIVTAAWKEPNPGWIDNYNGATMYLAVTGRGLLRSLHCYPEICLDMVPVDSVINSLILIARKLVQDEDSPKVYNLTASPHNLETLGRFSVVLNKLVREHAFNGCLWYPGLTLRPSYVLHLIADLFLHKLPAYIVDLIMLATGRKTFLVRTQSKVEQVINSVKWVVNRRWHFRNENLTLLCKDLNETDQKVFYTDRKKYDFEGYISNYVLGVRKLCTDEGVETLPQAKEVMKKLFYLDVLKNVAFFTTFWWIVLKYATARLHS